MGGAKWQHRPHVVDSSRLYSAVSDDKTSNVDDVAAAFEVGTSKILGKKVPYEDLTIGVIKETFPNENRVSQTPDNVSLLRKAGFQVVVQSGGALIKAAF
jgi:hypothetical protein